MKLVYGEFTIIYKERGISNLIEGNLLNSFKYIMTDYNKMLYANNLINVFKNILKENNNKELFSILKAALIKINDDFNPELINIICYVKLLNFLGVAPSFLECINCGSHDIKTFDISVGAVCNNCYHDTYLFSENTLKLLKLFQKVDIEKIEKLNITSKKTIEELNLFIKEYYETYTGIYLNIK
jgi:DNA repair protein RecO